MQDKEPCKFPVHSGTLLDAAINLLPISPPEQSAGQSPALPEPCPAGESLWYDSLGGISTRAEAGKA